MLAEEARRGGFDGIVCGHIHSANMREIDGLAYVNTGDWVESCTAVVERDDGALQLIDWAAARRRRALLQVMRADPWASAAAAAGRRR